MKKVRVGSRMRRVYGPPQTPLDRVLASEVLEPEQAEALRTLRRNLDPFELARAIERKLERIYALAHRWLSLRPPPSSSRSVTF